ncbi:MAG: ribonuclease D, partial [Desulfobacteraceae bacterium]
MGTGKSQHYDIITTGAQLEHLVGTLQHQSFIGVDLEADSMYHFKEKVCLLQMAAENLNVIIDPLQIPDLSSLRPLFSNCKIQKVFHGADYDIRSLYRDFKIEVNGLFDTQLACRFLGMAETSLEAVLKRWFHVNLKKKYRRKDWSKRPLPDEMIAYAAEDAHYLLPLAKKLRSKLKQKKRLSWVVEECEHLSKVRPVSDKEGPLFLNFKGAGKLDPRSLAVLEALLEFRKNMACKKDKPLFKIIRNKALQQLAIEKPRRPKDLQRLAVLSPNQIRMYGQNLLTAIQAALRLPEDDLPDYPRKKVQTVKPDVGKRTRTLKTWRDEQAKKMDIDPALLLTNVQINAIALQQPLDL